MSTVRASGGSAGEPDQGTLMALDSLRLGVAGKKGMWLALREVRTELEALASLPLDRRTLGRGDA